MFYTYRQNNSGGSFEINDAVAQFVIIEADNAAEANERAEAIGLYFDGVDEGLDCGCCGDRWSRSWGGDGEEAPEIYGKPVATYDPLFKPDGQPYAYVYYKDGSKTSFSQEVAQ